MSQLQAAAEVVRLQTIRTEAARQRHEQAKAILLDAFQALQREEMMLTTARERLLDVASREPQLAQTA
jgi:RNA polymerase-interacting CarD/CdnL/TRCF family regulator